MNNLLFSKYHYFFYGACTEDMLAGMIASSESKGCEFMQIVPMMIPAPPQSVVKLQKAPDMIPIFRIFVRCQKSEFARIMEDMKADAKKEQAEGLRI